MLEDAQLTSQNARIILSATVNNINLMNKIMEKVQKDADAGIVGYDDQGNPIFDMDLLSNKIVESEEERQQREMEMFLMQIKINLPEQWQEMEDTFNDP